MLSQVIPEDSIKRIHSLLTSIDSTIIVNPCRRRFRTGRISRDIFSIGSIDLIILCVLLSAYCAAACNSRTFLKKLQKPSFVSGFSIISTEACSMIVRKPSSTSWICVVKSLLNNQIRSVGSFSCDETWRATTIRAENPFPCWLARLISFAPFSTICPIRTISCVKYFQGFRPLFHAFLSSCNSIDKTWCIIDYICRIF